MSRRRRRRRSNPAAREQLHLGVERFEQRALAASDPSDQEDEFARGHREIDLREDHFALPDEFLLRAAAEGVVRVVDGCVPQFDHVSVFSHASRVFPPSAAVARRSCAARRLPGAFRRTNIRNFPGSQAFRNRKKRRCLLRATFFAAGCLFLRKKRYLCPAAFADCGQNWGCPVLTAGRV